MSVIQKIREKYATLMIVVICVSLVAFLLMDAFVGPKSFFQNKTEVGSVGGQGLDYRDFLSQVQNTENIYRANQPEANINEDMRRQIREQVWNQFISDVLLGEEFDKLGIGFTPGEMRDLTVSPDADPQIKGIPAFQNPQTGQFDPNKVVEFLQQLNTMPAGAPQRSQWIMLEQNLEKNSLQRKFSSLIMKALYVPSWLASEYAAEKDNYADISYVGLPYTSVSDSTVKPTDAELQGYLTNHAAAFHQEASRKIEYVSFDAIPTAKDTANVMKEINTLREDLDTMQLDDVPGFISRNSETQFFDGYIPGSMMQVPESDSIMALSQGGLFGPYFDNNQVVFAKMLDKKVLPDSVSVQHILLGTQQRPDSVAKKLADSLTGVINAGSDMSALVMQYSDDPAKAQNQGIYDVTQASGFVPEFKDFSFANAKGKVGVVKTQYGYHVIKILDQRHFETAYKVAYLSRPMDPSQETDNAAFSKASRFAGVNTTRDKFNKAVQQENLNKQVADNLHTSDYSISGIDQARELIRWVYEAEQDQVSGVFSLGNHYLVAVLTNIRQEGTATLADVRPQVEAAVRREKKAALMAGKMKGSDLQAIAQSTADSVLYAQHINFNTPFIPNAGFEPQVVGAAFNTALKDGKMSSPIYGNNGVYVLKVDSLSTEKMDSTAIQQQAKTQEAALQQQVLSQLFDVLKKQGDVEDHRLKFF